MTKHPAAHCIFAPCVSLLIALFATHFSSAQERGSIRSSTPAMPNVVLIMVDDAGLTDFAPFGGEAHMPNIQSLADRGVKFTGYRSSPLCAPSRAMFLTGIDNHLNGVATIPEVITEEQVGIPGYSLVLEPGVKTIADHLRIAGYRTYMTGKWHLGSEAPKDLPVGHGFDRSFALDASGADNWEQRSYSAFDPIAPWFEDGEPANLPDDFYSSKFVVDKMIDYISAPTEDVPSKPFLAYLSFQAIHIPIQAPAAFTNNYVGTYEDGWHSLRKKRWDNAKAQGIVPVDAPLAPMFDGHRKWESLTDEERRYYEKAMMVNAGMLEAMDHHIGRLLAFLEARGELDNTLFVVTSDNGPEHNDLANTPGMGLWYAVSGYEKGVATMGEKNSLVSIGSEWAAAAASPGTLFKFYSSSGGIRVPLIVAGAAIPKGKVRKSFAMVTDVTPTILDALNLAPEYEDGDIAITGRSLLPVITGEQARTYELDEPIGIEVSGNAALFQGPFKLTRNTRPHGDGTWRLYDIEVDPGETQDLASGAPDVASRMIDAYEEYADNVGVLPVPHDYEPMNQLGKNTLKIYWTMYRLQVLLLVALLACISVIAFRHRLRR